MKTRTRWMFIVGLTLLLTTLLLIPMTEAKRDRKNVALGNKSGRVPDSLYGMDRSPRASLARTKLSFASWKTGASSLQDERLSPVVSQAVDFGVSQPVRELPPASDAGSTTGGPGREVNELNEDIEREAIPGANPVDDALQKPKSKGWTVDSISPEAISPPTLVFEGLADTDNGTSLVNPPDTNGAVGPNHYVQAVNNRFRVFNKAGVPLTPPLTQSSLFASLYPQTGGICSNIDNGDPIVLYDRMADRWQISQFSFMSQTAPPYHQCVAISQTSDPAGAYYLYDFVLPGFQFPDYPKLGSWPDAYYMATRQFLVGGPFDGEGAFAFDRKKMLLGDPTAALIYFDVGSLSNSSSGMLPSDFDGITPPPAGAPNVFAIYTSATFGDPQGNALRLFDFHADFANPANSTFVERPESPVAVAAFDPRNPSGRTDIEQPPPAVAADNLDAIGDRLMFRLQYRNRGGVESLVTNHTVNVSGGNGATPATYQAAPRYYELRKNTPAGPYSVFDQATFSPDAGNGPTGTNRWMGSAAVDNAGNLAVGYSVSSTTVVPGIRYAGRAAGFTGGLNEGEATLFPGIGTQQASLNRWGDYTDLTVDPIDDCTFWYTNEYYPAGHTQFNWKTKVGKFTVGTCTAPPQGMLMGTVTDCASGLPLGRVMVEATGGPSSGFSSTTLDDGTYSMKLSPGTYSVTFSGRSCGVIGPLSVTITDGGTTTLNTCVSGGPRVAFGSAVDSGGNGNGIIDRNECNMLNVAITNTGCGPLTGVTGVLSSSTPGVNVTQPNSPYPNLTVGGTGTNILPFQVSTSTALECGTPISFILTITSNEGTFTIPFNLPTCTLAGSGSITNSDPTQTGRMTRSGIASSCAAPKAFPGVQDTASRHFDQYSFTNNGTVTACATFTVSNTCSNNLFYATYLGSYNPANIAQNYLGDPGSSATTSTWSVNVPAGQTVVLVIHEVNVPNTGCSGYTFSVSGLPTDGGGPCNVPAINPAGSTLINESCPPANNAIDPGERVTVSLKLMNNGGASTSNLVATLQPTGGVIAPSGPQSYGAIPPGGMAAEDFAFTAAGNCGNNITATLQLQDGANNLGTVSYTFKLGVLATNNVYSENFDGVIPPALPPGFTTDTTGAGIPWVTSTVNPDTTPNDAFGAETDATSSANLTSPVIAIPAGESAQLQFRNLYNMELNFDGEVLEISINGGPFQDILDAGGSFASGGYNGPISGTPLGTRLAWTGLSAGTTAAPRYITTVVNLPAAALGQNIRLRWRVGSDSNTVAAGQAGVRIDTITVSSNVPVCTPNCGGVRLVVTSLLTRTSPTNVQVNYSVQNTGTVTANNVTLTTARLGSTNGEPLPQPLGDIAPGASAGGTVNFTNSTPGAASTLTLGGTYTGGTFNSNRRVTIP